MHPTVQLTYIITGAAVLQQDQQLPWKPHIPRCNLASVWVLPWYK